MEGWFAQLERRALRRGVLTSVAQLKKAIETFIRAHDKPATKPFKWTKKAEKIIAAVERAKQVNQN